MSTIKVDTVQSTGGGAVTLTEQAAAKAFINGGDDATVKNSLNISTNTDSNTGTYTYGFTNAFTTDVDQHCGMGGMAGGGNRTTRVASTNTNASQIQIYVYNSAGSATDAEHYALLLGDLA